ncbi:imidazolonepropionase [Microcella frigidaquae]|uniref:Imidazolonepropionase n=1 Tax=Microcella frigidaquae TaxID=424758 RepID=A0A840X5W7_9MICO|nr:imidazolonepropionase [Microcella frigidaquae]MBB5617790.1 imidazolonepropionase [Microcella frigidaquae]NHN45495.1 imidazolonepropionase [Microcella frigidaquae]
MSTLVANIGQLVTLDPAEPDRPIRAGAALVIDGGQVAWVGDAAAAPAADRRIDAEGAAVIPGFVDSHSHLVFGGDRVDEFEARMAGRAYTAGGIRTTVAATRAASDDALRTRLAHLAAQARAQGTTTLEIKSGYGLTVHDEERALQLARELTPETTFLGAHVVPAEFVDDRAAYVDLVCGAMLAACAPHARFIDVFIDRGAFTVDEARRILTAGADAGLLPRVHAAQLEPDGGTALAVELGAASVDHGTFLTDGDVELLAASARAEAAGGPLATVATLLPLVEFATRQPYPDARRLLDAGAAVALASDGNPGSNFSTSMPLAVALAVRELGMTPLEALAAATRGGARALRRGDVGHLGVGARGDAIILDAPDHRYLAYRPGVPLVRQVLVGGEPTS